MPSNMLCHLFTERSEFVMGAIKVLIVDDSMFFREVLARGLVSSLPAGSQVERASNPFEARDLILSFDPDVMVLDVEMPKMNGIEFLRRLIVQYALPTVVLSSRPAYKKLAMEAGAYTFLEKPSTTLGSGNFVKQVAAEIRLAKEKNELAIKQQAAHGTLERAADSSSSSANTVSADMSRVLSDMKKMSEAAKQMRKQSGYQAPRAINPASIKIPKIYKKIRLIAIGASTGGTEALATVLKELRPPLPPIVIVQHIPPMFSKLFATRLDGECQVRVKEAEDGDKLEPGWVYVAPGDKQMRVKNSGGIMSLDVKSGPKVSGHCPSVDVLFESVANQIGDTALGVIMTGMGEDGARSLLKMRQAGAFTLGQDEASCVVYGMPRAAYEMGAVSQQIPLLSIASTITSIARQEG